MQNMRVTATSNGMNKKYIIVAIVVLIASWVGFSFGKKSAVAPELEEYSKTEIVATTTSPTTATPVKKTTVTATSNTATGASSVIAKDGSYLVYYTSSGFSPATLTIKKGKSVRFINTSNKAMSITTTDMTNSQVYSELNQSKTVGSGGTYDFTFLTAGTWGYTNRNNVADKGVVVVQ